MKRFVSFFALCTLTSAATGQEHRINVQRPAYEHELVELVSVEGLGTADRKVVSEFLAEKQSAMESARGRACPTFLNGEIPIEEFAVRLDQEIKEMNVEIAAAYQRMQERLSSAGRSTLQSAFVDLPTWSAETRAVDIVAVARRAAEASFKNLCTGRVGASGRRA